jgi:hypothetical protein
MGDFVVTIATAARFTFERSMRDVALLMRLHDERISGVGRPATDLYALKKSAVILCVTAWETYIEDTVLEGFEKRLAKATSTADVDSTFNSVAHAWLQKIRDDGESVQPTDLVAWSGDGWRTLLRDRVDTEVRDLNTPNTRNVRLLTKRYLGVDVTESWCWQRTNAQQAQHRLDDLIELRGRLVHRGRGFLEIPHGVTKIDVTRAITTVNQLVRCTDEALGAVPERLTLPPDQD